MPVCTTSERVLQLEFEDNFSGTVSEEVSLAEIAVRLASLELRSVNEQLSIVDVTLYPSNLDPCGTMRMIGYESVTGEVHGYMLNPFVL